MTKTFVPWWEVKIINGREHFISIDKGYIKGGFTLTTNDCTGTPASCESEGCQECCPHDDLDHGECLSCGADRLNDCIEDAEDAFEGDR